MIRLAVRVEREHAELVLAELMAFVPGGLEEREVDDDVEYVLYGAAGELPALGEVRAAAGGALVDVSTTRAARRLGRELAQLPHARRRAAACASGRRGSRRARARWTS